MKNQPRTLVLNCAALSADLIADASVTPTLAALAAGSGTRRLAPTFPALTCSVQASMLTGRPPAHHGIVGNGFYLRQLDEVRLWEQSAHQLDAPYAWAGMSQRPSIAMLFWQTSMFAPVDWLLTPKPMHTDERLILDCYGQPADLYPSLKQTLGEFPLQHYWGPLSGPSATKWIADATAALWRSHKPDICLTYLPLMDYSTQRFGPSLANQPLAADLRALDAMVAELADIVRTDGGRLVILSEYALSPVNRAVALNRLLRDAGLLKIRVVDGLEYLDSGASQAFALADHQVAHVYLPAATDKKRTAARVAEQLRAADGVAEVLDESGKERMGINHRRSGDLVCISQSDAWFSYYWWHDDAVAPHFARSVDIHSKPGYDPVELFVDRRSRTIPLDASLVRGSHGRVAPDGPAGIYLDTHPPHRLDSESEVAATDVAGLLGLA